MSVKSLYYTHYPLNNHSLGIDDLKVSFEKEDQNSNDTPEDYSSNTGVDGTKRLLQLLSQHTKGTRKIKQFECTISSGDPEVEDKSWVRVDMAGKEPIIGGTTPNLSWGVLMDLIKSKPARSSHFSIPPIGVKGLDFTVLDSQKGYPNVIVFNDETALELADHNTYKISNQENGGLWMNRPNTAVNLVELVKAHYQETPGCKDGIDFFIKETSSGHIGRVDILFNQPLSDEFRRHGQLIGQLIRFDSVFDNPIEVIGLVYKLLTTVDNMAFV